MYSGYVGKLLSEKCKDEQYMQVFMVLMLVGLVIILYHSYRLLKFKNMIDEINKVLSKNSMTDHVHIRLVISRGDKITPYQNPNANVGPINFVIIPEYKKLIKKFMKMELQLEGSPQLDLQKIF